MAGLVYHHLFTPKEIAGSGEFLATFQQTETQLRIAKDYDGEKERIVKLPIMKSPQSSLFHVGDDITIDVRLGNSLQVVNQSDPLFVLISDGTRAAIGFRITGGEAMKGAEGIPDRFFDLTRLSDNASSGSLSTSDWPDEFHISLKPEQYWGSIFCSQGNGIKQCVGYGKKPDFTKGVYLEIYRDKPAEEYIINYVGVTIHCTGKSGTNNSAPMTSVTTGQNRSAELQELQLKNFEQKVKQREVIMQQLKDLKGLEAADIITKEEFEKQKEKLLNELLGSY